MKNSKKPLLIAIFIIAAVIVLLLSAMLIREEIKIRRIMSANNMSREDAMMEILVENSRAQKTKEAELELYK
jgi:hypothetical protein